MVWDVKCFTSGCDGFCAIHRCLWLNFINIPWNYLETENFQEKHIWVILLIRKFNSFFFFSFLSFQTDSIADGVANLELEGVEPQVQHPRISKAQKRRVWQHLKILQIFDWSYIHLKLTVITKVKQFCRGHYLANSVLMLYLLGALKICKAAT